MRRTTATSQRRESRASMACLRLENVTNDEPTKASRLCATAYYLYSVRLARLMSITIPLIVRVCAGTPDTRQPNKRAALAARAPRQRWSGRRSRFWVQPLQGHERVGDRDQGHVMVQVLPGAPLEVVL